MTPPEPDDLVPPACRPTTDRLQAVLDGDARAAALDADPHAVACPACRDRVRAAFVLLGALPATPRTTVRVDLADTIVAAVRADARSRFRRRVLTGVCALAASVALVVWLRWPTPQPDALRNETVEVHPTPPLPEPPPAKAEPVRVGDQLARFGEALRESARPLTDPAKSAPGAFAALAEKLTRAATGPGAAKFEPARDTLAEIPAAARVGLEPVTGTARKGLDRFLHDVSAIQPGGSN